MFVGEPKRLEPGTMVQGFTADQMGAWVVAYVGPCLGGCAKGSHEQLYMVPMIGWLQVTSSAGFELRPAIMSLAGSVNDFLDVPDTHKFIAVLQDTEDAPRSAHVICRARFGDTVRLEAEPVHDQPTHPLAN